jgi:molecular chaperone DnaJ
MHGSQLRRWILAASISPASAGKGLPPAARRPDRQSWGSFRDIFSGIFTGNEQNTLSSGGRAGRSPGRTSNTRRRSSSGRRFAAAMRASRFTARRFAPPATDRRLPARHAVPGVQRHGPGDADGRPHEVQHSLPALRRLGAHLQRLPDLPRRGAGASDRVDRVSHQGGTRDGQRIRLQGKGNAGLNGGASRRSVCDRPHRARIRSSRAWATTFI